MLLIVLFLVVHDTENLTLMHMASTRGLGNLIVGGFIFPITFGIRFMSQLLLLFRLLQCKVVNVPPLALWFRRHLPSHFYEFFLVILLDRLLLYGVLLNSRGLDLE